MIRDKSTVRTFKHEDIKSWAEAREARPVQVRNFEGERVTDRVRFRFPSESFPDEEDLSWNEFFEIFDESKLEFVFEDIADDAVEQGNVYQFEPRKY